MPMQRYKPEQTVTILRQIEVAVANGKSTPQACKEAGVMVQTYYHWRKEYGGFVSQRLVQNFGLVIDDGDSPFPFRRDAFGEVLCSGTPAGGETLEYRDLIFHPGDLVAWIIPKDV